MVDISCFVFLGKSAMNVFLTHFEIHLFISKLLSIISTLLSHGKQHVCRVIVRKTDFRPSLFRPSKILATK